jgi:hypothetical protein
MALRVDLDQAILIESQVPVFYMAYLQQHHQCADDKHDRHRKL